MGPNRNAELMGVVRRYTIDNSLIQSELGLNSCCSFEQGFDFIKSTLHC